MEVVFTNDDNILIKLIKHHFSSIFALRKDNEVLFRKIHTYLIKNKFISGNIIDSGAWIGDNSIPWALNMKENIIYAIDPSPNNVDFIQQMAKANNISNIQTIQNALSDKIEIIGTNHGLDHCSFSKTEGNTKIMAETLDNLYANKKIDNIGCIHLDVEGFEFNAIKGSEEIIDKFHPIITFEQHLEIDDYMQLSLHLYHKGYDIYIINEILKGCRHDCRNFIAFPKNSGIVISDIHSNIGVNVLLSIVNWNNSPFKSVYSATIFGEHMSNKFFNDVKSVEYDEKHIFCVNDDNFTKIVVIDENKNWICSKYLMGMVNISCRETIINSYLSAQHEVNKNDYNIKDIVDSNV